MSVKKNAKQGLWLPLVNDFYSIQGEGYHVGKAAYFIRIGGCDIGCSWCDTKIAWDPTIHISVHIEEIVNNAAKFSARSIVVTGGEPSHYNLEPLTNLLKKKQITTFLETSGTNTITGNWDWICLSPKKNTPPVTSTYNKANELKVIIHDVKTDFRWAEETAKKMDKKCLLYLQSEWSRFHTNNPKIIDYVKKHPQWKISIQSHKFMGIL